MSLKEEIVSLIPKSEMQALFCDFAEVALDSAIDEGVLKDIPVIGTLVGTGNAFLSIKDRIFIKKIGNFLDALQTIPEPEIRAFIQKLEEEKVRSKVGEKLILLLDRQDDFDKASLIGFIFKSYIQGKIKRDDFDLLSHAITMAYLPDLQMLYIFDRHPKLLGDGSLGVALFSLNLAEMQINVSDVNDVDGTAHAGMHFILSPLGKTLAGIMEEYEKRHPKDAANAKENSDEFLGQP